jgi:DeoR/GlpR family transcriptional regulator of sugar metabolism
MTDVRKPRAGDRQAQIARVIMERGKVTVADLAAEFGVTSTSIRRDLSVLEAAGTLRRVHGGAVVHSLDSSPRGYLDRFRLHLAEKERIGRAAAGLIEAGDLLLFDTGTTTLQVVRNMPPHLKSGAVLSIVTNSVQIAEEISGWKAPNLVLLGGLYLPDYMATVGPQALLQLQNLMADKVFFGADGFTLAEGATSADVLLAELNQKMTDHARRVILLLDSSKIGRSGFVPIVRVDQIHTLITDMQAPAAIVQAVRKYGIEVIQV